MSRRQPLYDEFYARSSFGRESSFNSVGALVESLHELIMTLIDETDSRLLRKGERILKRMRKNRHFERIHTANVRTDIRGLDEDAFERIRKYRVRPLIVKEMPRKSLAASYIVQSELYRECEVPVVPPGRTSHHQLEIDYRILGALTLKEALEKNKVSPRDVLLERIGQTRMIMSFLEKRGHAPRRPAAEEVDGFGTKWRASIAAIDRPDLEPLTDALLESFRDELWEPYVDPSDTNILLLDGGLCHTDFERVTNYVPRSYHRLHDALSPSMGLSLDELLESGVGTPEAVLYRAVREMSHSGARDDYYSGIIDGVASLVEKR